MAGDKNIERVWAIVDKAGICMLTTRFDDCWKRGRPKTMTRSGF
jgi:hypothetical protein